MVEKVGEGLGISGFTLSIIGIVFAGYSGFIFSIIATIFCTLQQKKHKTKLGKAGFILGIIGIVLSIAYIILYYTYLAPLMASLS
jgi:uncharacterized membrane protein YagU involved in acid resistance